MRQHYPGGLPPRASQRHTKPAQPPADEPRPLFSPGQRVKWADRHIGTVIKLLGDAALIDADNTTCKSYFRVELAALTRIISP